MVCTVVQQIKEKVILWTWDVWLPLPCSSVNLGHIHQETDPGVCRMEQERWLSYSCSPEREQLQRPGSCPVARLLTVFYSPCLNLLKLLLSPSPATLGENTGEPSTASFSWLVLGNRDILRGHRCGAAAFPWGSGQEEWCLGAKPGPSTTIPGSSSQLCSGFCSARASLGEFVHPGAQSHLHAFYPQL